jgi:hypothetical protein
MKKNDRIELFYCHREAVEKELGEPLVHLPRSKKIKKKQRRRRIYLPESVRLKEEEQRREKILRIQDAYEKVTEEMEQKKKNEQLQKLALENSSEITNDSQQQRQHQHQHQAKDQ